MGFANRLVRDWGRRDGVVTLTGVVSSYAKKLAAQEAAHRISGGLDVANDVEVRPDGVFVRSEADIARAVRHILEWDALVPDEPIKSTVSHGWVTLEGDVDFWHQRFVNNCRSYTLNFNRLNPSTLRNERCFRIWRETLRRYFAEKMIVPNTTAVWVTGSEKR